MMPEFKREPRYYVFKMSKLDDKTDQELFNLKQALGPHNSPRPTYHTTYRAKKPYHMEILPMSEIKSVPNGATHTRFNLLREKREYWKHGLDGRWYLFDRRQWTTQGLPCKPNGLFELDKEQAND